MTNPADKDRLIDHSYDGIQEYDNPMPAWWVFVFWATIIFSIFYYINPGGTGMGEPREVAYEKDMAAFRAAHPVDPAGASPDVLLALAGKPSEVGAGKTVFAAKCAVCHAVDGGGIIGPNLTDDAWLHGGTIDAIHTTVSKGVLAKGMPAWDKLLSSSELNNVVAYIWTLHGTTPAKPKAPEGQVVTR